METPIYEIKSLVQSYGGKTVLSIEHLSIAAASIVGLIGPNGSGKSSLLRILGLIERPAQGHLLFKGKPVEPFSDEARFRITMLPQEPFLMKRSVFNNVSYGLKLRGDRKDVAQRVDRALAMVGLASRDFVRRSWFALSGGESQRVALAARLALNPEVLLLDEPTASVDAASAQLIKEASLRARQDSGTTLVIASHDWQWLYEICDEVLHLYNGRIFGKSRDTLIFGPWQKTTEGVWVKPLPDQQQLRVPEPPEPGAAAVIGTLSASVEKPHAAGKEIVLRGTVSRLSLERKTGHVFATVVAGDIPFTVCLSSEQKEAHSVFPGQTLYLCYSLDHIRWI